MSEELKPCPFCGNENIELTELEEKDERRYFERGASCDTCGCTVTGTIGWNTYKDMTIDEASNKVKMAVIELWNNRTENAAQAQEIDELKAYVERLHDLVDSAFIKKSEDDDGWCILSVFVNELKECVKQTPAQSLSARDAAIEEDVIERCLTRLGCEYDINRNQFWWSIAIRSMPRKYNV